VTEGSDELVRTDELQEQSHLGLAIHTKAVALVDLGKMVVTKGFEISIGSQHPHQQPTQLMERDIRGSTHETVAAV